MLHRLSHLSGFVQDPERRKSLASRIPHPLFNLHCIIIIISGSSSGSSSSSIRHKQSGRLWSMSGGCKQCVSGYVLLLLCCLATCGEAWRVDCTKFVFAPKCRGVSAKRTALEQSGGPKKPARLMSDRIFLGDIDSADGDTLSANAVSRSKMAEISREGAFGGSNEQAMRDIPLALDELMSQLPRYDRQQLTARQWPPHQTNSQLRSQRIEDILREMMKSYEKAPAKHTEVGDGRAGR